MVVQAVTEFNGFKKKEENTAYHQKKTTNSGKRIF